MKVIYTTMERFWNKVNKNTPSGCWEWTGGLNDKGYGRIRVNWILYGAHRFSYYLHHPITKNIKEIEYEVMHTCDNPVCVNPYHLKLDTHANNIKDKVEKGRQLYGQKHPSSKLTDDLAREIIAKNDGSVHIRKILSKEYNISRQRIDDLINGKWKFFV